MNPETPGNRWDTFPYQGGLGGESKKRHILNRPSAGRHSCQDAPPVYQYEGFRGDRARTCVVARTFPDTLLSCEQALLFCEFCLAHISLALGRAGESPQSNGTTRIALLCVCFPLPIWHPNP